jgi:hypothetical protein
MARHVELAALGRTLSRDTTCVEAVIAATPGPARSAGMDIETLRHHQDLIDGALGHRDRIGGTLEGLT